MESVDAPSHAQRGVWRVRPDPGSLGRRARHAAVRAVGGDSLSASSEENSRSIGEIHSACLSLSTGIRNLLYCLTYRQPGHRYREDFSQTDAIEQCEMTVSQAFGDRNFGRPHILVHLQPHSGRITRRAESKAQVIDRKGKVPL